MLSSKTSMKVLLSNYFSLHRFDVFCRVIRNLNRRDCPPGSSLVSVDLTFDEIPATGSRQRFAPD